MNNFISNMEYTLKYGEAKSDRTGTGTISAFGMMEYYSLTDGQLPVVTSKKVHLKSVIHELIWMISGDTNIRYLKANGVRIWDEWIKPGTEEYEPMTYEEMVDALDKVQSYLFRELEALGLNSDYKDPKNTEFVFREIFRRDPVKLVGGDLGPIYGKQWRSIVDTRRAVIGKETFDTSKYTQLGAFINNQTGETEGVWERTIDQLSNIIEILQNDPESRRMVIDSWQVKDLDEMALTPCHHNFQFYTVPLSLEERIALLQANTDVPRSDGDYYDVVHCQSVDEEQVLNILERFKIPKHRLSCLFFMRSNDIFLGKPFNITFYGLLTHALCNMLNMEPGDLVYVGGDCHIYNNHIEQVNEQLSRNTHPLPTIRFKTKGKDIRELEFDDFIIENYQHEAPIRAKVAV